MYFFNLLYFIINYQIYINVTIKIFLFINPKDQKNKPNNLARQNTLYLKQTIIDVDDGTIDEIEIKLDASEIISEHLPNSAVLHVYKKP